MPGEHVVEARQGRVREGVYGGGVLRGFAAHCGIVGVSHCGSACLISRLFGSGLTLSRAILSRFGEPSAAVGLPISSRRLTHIAAFRITHGAFFFLRQISRFFRCVGYPVFASDGPGLMHKGFG